MSSEASLSSLALVGLVCVPLVPLLLFGFGVRPPDTSNLPVSTDQLWATGGIVAATAVVVLGCIVVPGGLQGLGGWIAGDVPLAQASNEPRSGGRRGPPVHGPLRRDQFARADWRRPGPAPLMARAVTAKPALSYAQQKEAYHLAHLRSTPLILPFSDQGKVSISFFILTSLGALLILIVIFGQLVKAAYAVDASAPPPPDKPKGDPKTKPSVEEEFQAREKRKTASETPEQTAARRKKEKPMWDKRRKEEAASKPKVATLTVQQMYDAAEKKKTAGETPEQTAKRREKEKPKWEERFKKEKEKAEKSKDKKAVEVPGGAASVVAGDEQAPASTKGKLEKIGRSLKRRLAGLTSSS